MDRVSVCGTNYYQVTYTTCEASAGVVEDGECSVVPRSKSYQLPSCSTSFTDIFWNPLSFCTASVHYGSNVVGAGLMNSLRKPGENDLTNTFQEETRNSLLWEEGLFRLYRAIDGDDVHIIRASS